MDLPLIFTIAGVLISIIVPLIGYIYKRRKDLKNFYSVIWKSSHKIIPRDFLGERPYDQYYFERGLDNILLRMLQERRNIMLIGPPLSGKSRAVFNSLRKLEKSVCVLIPKNVTVSEFHFPKDFKFWKKKIIFVDDFQNFIDKKDNYYLLFKSAKEKNIPLIANCHSGREFLKVKNRMIEQNLELDTVFGDNIIEIEKVSVEEGKEVARMLNMKWDNIKFNGTIGSIFMKLSEMERRYDQCDHIEKTILRSLRTLYTCGIYQENTFFKLEWIKKITSRYELEGKDFEWTGWIKILEEKEFIKLTKRNIIWAEDAYLEYIIKPETEISIPELFEEVIEIFKDNPEVLQMAGEKAYDIGNSDIQISNYMKIAISAFKKILMVIVKNDEQSAYIKANKYLGLTYWSLSKAEDTVENCTKSIEHYNAVAETKSIQSNNFEYANIKSKLGNTYSVLAEVENKAENCRIAIEEYNEALKVFTIDSYPREYAQAKSNLGAAYLVLSDDWDSEGYLKKAEQCFEESLRIRTLSEDRVAYAVSKNSLASTFARLSLIENPEKNLALALNSYNDILKIYKKEKFPIQYGMTMNNIGSVYCLLSNIKDKKQNGLKALHAYEDSLEVRTLENAPVQFSKTMFNLGDAYMILNEAEENMDYLYKAIECFNGALNLNLSNITPFRQGEIYSAMGKSYMLLAEKENKLENYNKGMEAFGRALQIFSEKDYPDMNKKTQSEIFEARKKLAV